MKKILIWLIFALFLFSSAYAEEMVTITDMAGRQVKIPKKVEKIVALSASLRYIVYLQAFDKVVGIEDVEKRDVMRGKRATGKAYWLAIKDKVQSIPSIGEGGPGKLPDFEKLIAVNPQVVITFDIEHAELIQKKTGIPALVIKYAGTEGFEIDDIKNTFIFLGKILDREKRAAELNSYIDKIIEDLRRRSMDSKRPTIYVGAISARGPHGITSTEAFYPPLDWLNVKNVADEVGKKGHLFIDREKLIQWNPDYLFIDTGGFFLVNEDYLKNKNFYKTLKAVKEGRVYTLFPHNFYRTNIEILFANAYFVGKVIYPEKFKDVDPQRKAREIFKKFLGVDVFDELRKDYKGFGKVEFTDLGIIVN
ncbi:MAG: iron ABC transporter substrate-binding protein [Caldimicrobium sp.]